MKLIEFHKGARTFENKYAIEYSCGCIKTIGHRQYTDIRKMIEKGQESLCQRCAAERGARVDHYPEIKRAAEMMEFVDRHWRVAR